MSAKYSPQILSTKGECTFVLLNFLITHLCNSSANFLSDIISFLTVPLEVDLSTSEAVSLSKLYKPLKQVHIDIHHISDFWQYKMLYRVTIYQQMFFHLNL